MEESSPKCFLGCSNVRTWTVAISILNIVFVVLYAIMHIAMMALSSKWSIALIIWTVLNLPLIYVNILLRSAALKREIKPIRLWLWIYTGVFVIWTVWLLLNLVSAMKFVELKFIVDIFEGMQKIAPTIETIDAGVFVIWLAGSFYPICQLYKFDKGETSSAGQA